MNRANGMVAAGNGGVGRRASRTAALLLSAGLVGTVFQAQASPQGGQVVAGRGNITNPNANLTVVHQNSNKLIINWNSFDIGAGQTVKFVQPGASSAALNRIFNQNATQVFGDILSNGQVFLINPNGIIFGKDSYVNTGALFASSLSISDDSFMSGKYRFVAPTGVDGGAVVNHGTLVAADGGSVNLMGGTVYNDGVIQANLGQVDLVAGHAVIVDFDGDGLMSFEVTQPVLHKMLDGTTGDAVVNAGTVEADGGTVIMSANVARDVFTQAVNNTGVIEATGVMEKGGSVYLDGSVTLSATGSGVVDHGVIDASSAQGHGGNVTLQSDFDTLVGGANSKIDVSAAAGAGGTVQLLGNRVGLMHGASVDASGAFGGGTVLVGGDYHGQNPDVQDASRTYLSPDSSIHADATTNGDGGKIILWSNDGTQFYGSLSADGGARGGNGGLVETSSDVGLDITGKVDALAPAGSTGTWLIDPVNIIIATGGGATTANVSAFANGACAGTCTIDPTTFNGSGTTVDMQAQNDITVTNGFTMSTASIVLQAGEAITVAANQTISTATSGTNITLVANNTGNAETDAAGNALVGSGGTGRGANPGTITFGTGDTLNAGTGNIKIDSANTGTHNGNVAFTGAGTNTVETTGGSITISAGGAITSAGTTTITTANGLAAGSS